MNLLGKTVEFGMTRDFGNKGTLIAIEHSEAGPVYRDQNNRVWSHCREVQDLPMGEQLKAARLKKGMSCEDMGHWLGLGERRIREMEASGDEIKLGRLRKWVKVLGYKLIVRIEK